MKTILALIAILFVFAILPFNATNAQKPKTEKAKQVKVDPEFAQFWKEFKSAVIKKDKKKIIDMVNFPFIIENIYSESTDMVKNSNEFLNKKLEGYSDETATAYGQLIDTNFIKLIKKIKTLTEAGKNFMFENFNLPKDSKVFLATKDYCNLIITKINGQIKLICVAWGTAGD
jgi:hypothetical protein